MTLSLRLATGQFTLERPMASARQAIIERETLTVGLFSGVDLVGIGEASPLPGYSVDSIGAVRAALEAVPSSVLAELMACLTRRDLDAAHELTSNLPAAARFGLESAALGSVAHRSSEPLHRWLGAREEREFVPALLVSVGDPRTAAEIDASVRGRGARALKLKVGANVPAELAFARTLRDRIPEHVELRFDANQSLDVTRDSDFVRDLGALGPCFIEEPFADPRALLSAPPFVTFALDESLRTLSPLAAAQLTSAAPVGAWVLKPTELGLLGALRLAQCAERHGARAIVSHTYEGIVGFAALCEFALGLKERAPGLDCDYLPGRTSLPARSETGSLRVHAGLGLGLDLASLQAGFAWT